MMLAWKRAAGKRRRESFSHKWEKGGRAASASNHYEKRRRLAMTLP